MREWIRGPVLDSRLYVSQRASGRNADLYFILSVYLHRHEPDSTGLYAGAVGGVTQIQRWTDAEWRDFQNGFWRTVTQYWNNRFWLVPPPGYRELDWPPGTATHRPNVKCGLQLWLHQRPENARITVTCVRPVANATFRSSMSRTASVGELDPADISSASNNPSPTETQTQTVILHEVGHLLGLDHVANNPAACPTPNASGCYGTTAWQRADLMGWGQRLEPWHAWPWRDRIRYHTGRGGWRVTMTRPAPTLLPRTSSLDAGVGGTDAGVPRPGGI